MTNQFDPRHVYRTLVIVGVGGTGAQVARLMARVIYDMRRAHLDTPAIVLIDPDIVEEKNVGRQLFTAADAAAKTPKAEAVGKRLNMALGLDISWFVEPVNAKKHLSQYETITISCVDNHLARAEVHESNGLLIGAGNYRDGGQVVIGNTNDRNSLIRSFKHNRDDQFSQLPKEGLLFPALLEPDPAPVVNANLSCADLVLRGEQDVLINDWIALVAAQYATALLRRQPVTTFATFINSTSMSVRSLPISREEIEAYLG